MPGLMQTALNIEEVLPAKIDCAAGGKGLLMSDSVNALML